MHHTTNLNHLLMALTKPNALLHSLFFLTSLLISPCLSYTIPNPQNGYGLQGMFVFGSSVVDNGNNNYFPTPQNKANYLPYGIDFPLGPTGRFSNGKNVADLIGDHLGLPLLPAFADPKTKGNAIVHGVNFASAGSGILDESGTPGTMIPLAKQVQNFEKMLPELEEQLKGQREEILPNYVFLMAAGHNDYLLNYFSNMTTSPEAFAARLISAYTYQMKRLYNMGARNFLVLSVYPLGCSPAVNRGQGCSSEINDICSIFYDQLVTTIEQIIPQMSGSHFTIVNSVKIITNIINNSQALGLSNVTGPCCEGTGGSCKRYGKVCPDRNKYAYFDGHHNTQALSALVADKAFASSDLSEVYPMNLQALVRRNNILKLNLEI